MTSGHAAQARRDASDVKADESDTTRGRPRDLQRRATVIAATRELLIANGYDEITLSGVARHAGVSRPFVYEHWGSKFALVEEAIFAAPGALPAIDELPFLEALTSLITGMVRVQSDPAYLAGMPGVATVLYRRPDLVEQVEARYMAPIRARWVRLIERGKAEGLVRPGTDGSALMDTVRGAVTLHTSVNKALAAHDLVDHLRSLIVHGIAAEERFPYIV
jgi:AcrR family transcriptional regulator